MDTGEIIDGKFKLNEKFWARKGGPANFGFPTFDIFDILMRTSKLVSDVRVSTSMRIHHAR